ncbi:MAG: hypothetical protein LBE38_00845 [Deltaproteobacteria bacterium]|jgi:hypothetical protein|nr:hypothetical protein [Deltaproteobacteria bacterium]
MNLYDSNSQEQHLKVLAFKTSKRLTLRLLEKRYVAANNVAELLEFFADKCLELLQSLKPFGYPCLTLASEITGRLIQAGRLTNKDSVAKNLSENMETLEVIKEDLKSQDVGLVLKCSVEMVLKMLETVILSTSSIPKILAEISARSDFFLS